MVSLNSYKKNISNLWNHYSYVKKYDNYKYTSKDKITHYLEGRRDVVIKYLNKLKLGKKTTILELGYGAGQNAAHFMKFCNKFYGIEISVHQANFAKKRNKGVVSRRKAKFLVGSMEKKFKIKSNSIDVIIVVGALQYIMDLNKCFSECRRVLKKDGKLIIAQTNTFSINEMKKPRKFIVNMARILLNEQFQYSHSTTLKSILLETKLKKYFKKYKNSWWMNSWLFNSGLEDTWNFKVKRRLLSYNRLKKIIKNKNFSITSSCSSPFFYNNKNILSKIIFCSLDFILINLNKIFIFSFFLKHVGASTMFLCEKK